MVPPLSSPERWQASEPVHEPMPRLGDDGQTIEVQNWLPPAPMINRDRTRGAQQALAGGQSNGNMHVSSGSASGMPLDSRSSGADFGRPKIDTTQSPAQGTSANQSTGGAQSTGGQSGGAGQTLSGGQNGGGGGQGAGQSTSSGQNGDAGQIAGSGQNAGGGQGANSGSGAQAADSSAAPADSGQGGGADAYVPEVINIKAADMQWDPAHAHLHQGDGEVFVYANSSVEAQFSLDSPGQGLSIFARADKAKGEWPTVTVSIDGTPIGSITVNSTSEKKFYLPISVDPGQVNLQLSYMNDFYDPNAHQDRNLYISHIKVVAQGTQQSQ